MYYKTIKKNLSFREAIEEFINKHNIIKNNFSIYDPKEVNIDELKFSIEQIQSDKWEVLVHDDIMYDQYVNGNFGKHSFMTYNDRCSVNVFTGLVHDGWSIQKNTMKHLLEFPPLIDMYSWYDDDVKDNLYKNFGHIEYGNDNYIELTTDAEFKTVRIGF